MPMPGDQVSITDAGDAPHDERTCPSAAVGGVGCGYYCYWHPSFTGTGSHWVYCQAIGKTILHEDGFRTQQLRLLAVVPGSMIDGLEQIAEAMGLPVIAAQASAAECNRYHVPYADVLRLRERQVNLTAHGPVYGLSPFANFSTQFTQTQAKPLSSFSLPPRPQLSMAPAQAQQFQQYLSSISGTVTGTIQLTATMQQTMDAMQQLRAREPRRELRSFLDFSTTPSWFQVVYTLMTLSIVAMELALFTRWHSWGALVSATFCLVLWLVVMHRTIWHTLAWPWCMENISTHPKTCAALAVGTPMAGIVGLDLLLLALFALWR